MARQQRTRALASLVLTLLISVGVVLSPARPSSVHALDAPVLVSPADGLETTPLNYPPLGIPEFVWRPVPGTIKYRIQIDDNIGFTSPFETTTSNNRYTPHNANQFPDGVLYWRVRVETPSPPSDYSEIRSFVKNWAIPQNAPQLNSPVDGEYLDFYERPIFSWEPVVGAADYRLEIALSPTGFDSPVYQKNTLATAHQPVNKLANGTYYWRVVPLDVANREGAISEVRSFVADYNLIPTLLEPDDGAQPTFTPTFRWTAVRGAQFYRLEYSTDPSFGSNVTRVDTRNISWTPTNPLPNDVNYYWRVRVHSGNSVSEWSEVRSFVKQWYIQPTLLTPQNNYSLHGQGPMFSWTPVPGASRYKIEVSANNSFPPQQGWTDYTANTFYVRPNFNLTNSTEWYWRVTPIDRAENLGVPSTVFKFYYTPDPGETRLIYPLYYYTPDDSLNPREDRTVPLPVLMWSRMLSGTEQIAAYRIQVDDNFYFTSPDWEFETENLSAVPTADDPFTPDPSTEYYWRVRPLTGLGGGEIGQWSQKWKTRIDLSLGLTPTVGYTPTLLRPPHAAEWVETAPLFEWWPVDGADSYELEINADAGFDPAYTVHTAVIPYPAYAPQERLGYGTYYWRVRALSGGVPLGDWSAGWRFQIAAQSRWQDSRGLGDPANRVLIGSDPSGDVADPNYDLTTLYAAQSQSDWFIGFAAITDSTDMVYVLYLDLDSVDGSGATSDPEGYDVSTIAAHQPEQAIYVRQSSGGFDATNVYLYEWAGGSWDPVGTLDDVSGALLYDAGSNYLEMQIPNTAIGMDEETGSAAVTLFTVPVGGGQPQDTVPSDPNIPGGTTISRFTHTSEHVILAAPPTNIGGDPRRYPSVIPFIWHPPIDTDWNGIAWNGFHIQVATDVQFTNIIEDYTVSGKPLVSFQYTDNEDLQGDNTYYWRARPVYGNPDPRGSWSQPFRFDREGFVPQNPTISVDFATPTFSWDMAEGAKYYELVVDNDPNFGSPVFTRSPAQTRYTYDHTLPEGIYYWRVRINRHDGVNNDWSPTQVFTLTLPRPTGLNHDPPGVVPRAPTLCWNHLLTPTVGNPVIAAAEYRVEVSQDPSFSSIYDSAEIEQPCWTPVKGYDDGDYYWHVAMKDGDGRQGSYTPAQQFTKQYPVTTLVSPTNGAIISRTPTFVWTPVTGAAMYRIEIAKDPSFSPLYDHLETCNVRYTPLKEFDIGEVYYWRVAIRDDNGRYGPYTDATLILDPLPYKAYLPLMLKSN